ncbi:hypothetical protein [Paenibacillus sp. 1P03SA]
MGNTIRMFKSPAANGVVQGTSGGTDKPADSPFIISRAKRKDMFFRK